MKNLILLFLLSIPLLAQQPQFTNNNGSNFDVSSGSPVVISLASTVTAGQGIFIFIGAGGSSGITISVATNFSDTIDTDASCIYYSSTRSALYQLFWIPNAVGGSSYTITATASGASSMVAAAGVYQGQKTTSIQDGTCSIQEDTGTSCAGNFCYVSPTITTTIADDLVVVGYGGSGLSTGFTNNFTNIADVSISGTTYLTYASNSCDTGYPPCYLSIGSYNTEISTATQIDVVRMIGAFKSATPVSGGHHKGFVM